MTHFFKPVSILNAHSKTTRNCGMSYLIHQYICEVLNDGIQYARKKFLVVCACFVFASVCGPSLFCSAETGGSFMHFISIEMLKDSECLPLEICAT